MATNQKKSKLKDFFLHAVQDIYYAEKRLVKALPEMEKAATSKELKNAFSEHRKETQKQAERLEKVFDLLNEKPRTEKCEAIEGLIDEAHDIIDETEEGTMTRDVALILAGQKVEHYEIATYGSLVQLAQRLKEDKVADIFQEILDEEKNADQLLTKIAESGINEKAYKEEAYA